MNIRRLAKQTSSLFSCNTVNLSSVSMKQAWQQTTEISLCLYFFYASDVKWICSQTITSSVFFTVFRSTCMGPCPAVRLFMGHKYSACFQNCSDTTTAFVWPKKSHCMFWSRSNAVRVLCFTEFCLKFVLAYPGSSYCVFVFLFTPDNIKVGYLEVYEILFSNSAQFSWH